MKITYEDSKKVNFGSLKPGDVFLYNCEDVCMKIENIAGEDEFINNAIFVENGEALWIDYGKQVDLIDYEFKVIRK